MKLFTLMMSFWLLFLSGIPCGDTIDRNIPVTVSSDTDHEQHEDQGGHCTPLCSCSCCSAIAFLNAYYYSSLKKAFENGTYPIYKNPFYGKVSLAIWQPPKLS